MPPMLVSNFLNGIDGNEFIFVEPERIPFLPEFLGPWVAFASVCRPIIPEIESFVRPSPRAVDRHADFDPLVVAAVGSNFLQHWQNLIKRNVGFWFSIFCRNRQRNFNNRDVR